MKIGKSQHTLPRFYLERFLHPGWVYLRGSQQAKWAPNAKNVSIRNWYYSPSPDGANLDYLNNITESVTAPILRELLTTKYGLLSESKRSFSYFIANLVLRVPATIEEVGETTLEAFEKATDMAKKIVEKQKVKIEENQPFITVGSYTHTYKEWENLLESERQRSKTGKAMMETIISLITDLAPVISKMSWIILEAPEKFFFVTTDRPVCLTDLEGSRVGAGWANSDVVGTLPLSPRRYLVLYGSPLGKWSFQHVSKEAVKDFNLRTINFANYAIYSLERCFPAENWLHENKGS